MQWTRLLWSALRVLLATVACVLCGVGIGGPVLLSYVGAALLLVVPAPHLLRARRLLRDRSTLAGIDALATATVLACPSLFFVTLRSVEVAWFGVVPVVLAAALTVSVAVSRELGPVARRDVVG